MADDGDVDPFAHLAETLRDDPGDREGNATGGEGSDGVGSGGASASGSAGGDVAGNRTTDPAFSYEAAVQRPFYARAATVEAFDAWLNYELERDLSERGHRNVAVREMTDALLRTVVEEDIVDEVAERFARAREATSPPTE